MNINDLIFYLFNLFKKVLTKVYTSWSVQIMHLYTSLKLQQLQNSI